ncbi:outer membrane beta-barrel protein [Jiella sonneratiae]|uniref:Outer membrane beta-barrel protein n=1 Tax=Jiella sonneratiae TaxID=2816856 RepID=A0ABS3J6E0_9HYPH|nr:outer membrane beta-barrel protein [Jiella sonneratiae]MBO0905220.1 outer membrane beta-barrel protein [Jiella sonneratiae]
MARKGTAISAALFAAAALGASVAAAGAQEKISDTPLRRSVDAPPATTRLADPKADLIDALGAYDRQRLVAPDAKGADPAKLRQVADPAAEDDAAADDDPAAEDDGKKAKPRFRFDLTAGPSTTLLDGGRKKPAARSNRAAAPLGAVGLPVDGGNGGGIGDAEDVDEKTRTGTATREDGLPDEANPTLGPGLADETLPARSTLRSNRAAETVDQAHRLKQAGSDDPFAPIGIRTGSFILYPELIQTIGVSNNLENDAAAAKGAFAETILSSRLVSDWASNAAEFNSRLAYRHDFAGENREDPSASLDGRLRLDVSRDTVATLRGAIDYDRENYSDVLDDTALSGRAGVFSGSLAAELSHDFHPVSVSGTLTAARKSYTDLPEGSVDEDYTTLTAALRTGYDLSPALQPFVEASLGRRLFDVPEAAAGSGPSRNAWLPGLRAGLGIDLRDKLKGEIAVGYAWNVPDDASVATAASPTLDLSLVWSPQRGTDVTLAGRTTFEPELTGQSATTSYETSLAIAHSLGARTTLTAAARFGYDDSTLPNEDKMLLSGEAGFTYWLNRQFALTGSYEHRRAFAVLPDNRYSADTVKLGVTLQR